MPTVTLIPIQKEVEVPTDTLLFDAACRAGLPVASSCSSAAVCGKCVMQVVEGAENLSPPSEHEKKLLQRDKRQPSERISCMVRILGNCKISTTYW